MSEISSDSDLLSHANHAQSHDNIQSDLLSEIDSQPVDKKAKKKQLKKALQASQAKTDTDHSTIEVTDSPVKPGMKACMD